MAVKKHWDGIPLPGLLDPLKARDGVVLRIDDDCLPDKGPGVKQGKSFAGPLFYECVSKTSWIARLRSASVYSLLCPGRRRTGVQR
jgi:hypothetical protein